MTFWTSDPLIVLVASFIFMALADLLILVPTMFKHKTHFSTVTPSIFEDSSTASLIDAMTAFSSTILPRSIPLVSVLEALKM